MHLIKRIFHIVAILFTFSCNKVIDIDLRDTEIKYTIEGTITNESGLCKVYITESKNFNEDNQFNRISNAIVTVKDNGTEIVLPETQPGVYETNLINGTPGHVYQLTVTINNSIFTASCTMPQPVLMDTIYISRGPFGQYKFATISYTDQAGINNGYRFIQYVNGIKEPTIFWENDEFTDGQLVTLQLDASAPDKDDPRNIKTGDEVMIEMLCLDDPIYQFWYTLRSGGGDGDDNTASPSNPISNITGGALGYFSAHTISRKTVIAP